MTNELISIETDLAAARQTLAERVKDLRTAKQQVRDAQAIVIIARRTVARINKRKSRAATGKN